jgi:DNA segregation ATPase FtsK/SpoIIIE, S-DNA-T family
MDLEIGLLIQLTLLAMLLAVLAFFKAVELYRRLQATERPQEQSQPLAVDLSTIDVTPLPGAGNALANPPTDLAVTLAYLRARYGQRRYTLPLGWQVVGGRPVCVVAHLVDDVFHVLVTAKSRAGKDSGVVSWLLALALLNPPSRLQVAIVDGKGGLDWIGWRGKAYTWLLAINREEIVPAMVALTQERERRGQILRQAGVSSWENYRGTDLPLLVIYVSELLLLQDAASPKELERWLNSELSASGALGLRYIVATQTASNFATRWRSQIDLFYAGYQPSASQDTPNTGLTVDEIVKVGGVPPSQLPELPRGRGVFTAVQGRLVETVRVGYIDDAQRARWLAQLPDASKKADEVSRVSWAATATASASVAVTLPGTSAQPARHDARAEQPGHAVTTGVSAHQDAGNAMGSAERRSGNGGSIASEGNAAGNGQDLTDEEIIDLLLANTPTRQIAARMRGRMQRRLRRIDGVRAAMRSS